MMFKRVILSAAILAAGLFAQEGHPLAGTWHGEWHPASGPAAKIVMYMKWDGQNVVGTINPGPGAIPLKVASFQGWNVHFEADAKDHISADGKVENVGSYHRTISGTWSQGASKGSFKLTRD
jgi:hypothetical protein